MLGRDCQSNEARDAAERVSVGGGSRPKLIMSVLRPLRAQDERGVGPGISACSVYSAVDIRAIQAVIGSATFDGITDSTDEKSAIRGPGRRRDL